MTHHKCHIATARIGYRGRADERVLDTTVKSGTGLGAVFAPTWKLVMGVKRGELSWSAYVEGYTALMRDRYRENQAAFLEALNSERLVVCCYCKDMHATTRHCHRYLLVDILEKVATRHSIAFEYVGEVTSSRSD